MGEVYRALDTELNRAVAIGMAFGPEAGLALVESIAAGPALRDYHLLPSVRGDLLARLDRAAEASAEFHRAAELTENEAERSLLLRRAESLSGCPAGRGTSAGGDVGVGDDQHDAVGGIDPGSYDVPRG